MKRDERRVRATLRESPREWYQIRNSVGGAPAEILIYDEIGWYGVSAANFVRELAAVDATEIVVRLNSPGGDVFDGIAILNALRNHPAKVTSVVDGLAASAASFIAMAGDEIVMSRNSEMMVHDSWGICIGNAADMADMAQQLDRISNNIASIYADRAGGTVDEWRAVMRNEAWYSDQEAVDAGLADRVDTGAKTDDGSKAKATFDLSIFNFAGRRAAPTPPRVAANTTQTPSAAEAGAKGKDAGMATLKEGLAQRLGIPADADDETTLAAVDEALAERTDDTPAEPTADQIAAAAQKRGLTIVDRAQYEATVAAAAEGREARQQQLREADETVVNSAISDGKIPPANRPHWLALLSADREGTAATLAALPKGLIPMAEIGHSVAAEESDISSDALDAFGATLGFAKGALNV